MALLCCECKTTLPIGQTGPQGPAGANGLNGTNGTNGTNGATVSISAANPTSPSLSPSGSVHINSSTWEVFQWNGATWVSQGIILPATNYGNFFRVVVSIAAMNALTGQHVDDITFVTANEFMYKWNGTTWLKVQGTGSTSDPITPSAQVTFILGTSADTMSPPTFRFHVESEIVRLQIKAEVTFSGVSREIRIDLTPSLGALLPILDNEIPFVIALNDLNTSEIGTASMQTNGIMSLRMNSLASVPFPSSQDAYITVNTWYFKG
jgi:hypothetical protein